MKRLLVLAVLGYGCPTAFAAETPAVAPETIKARDYVRDLADPRFKVRDQAARELMKLGRKAKPALIEGTQSADPEVWSRCTQLLPQVLAEDLKARIEAFLADADGKQPHDLPMMEQYKKLVGNDAPSRKLFAEIVRNNGNFLEACEVDAKRAAERFSVRANEMLQQMNNGRTQPRLNANDLAALFLVGSGVTASKDDKKADNAKPVAVPFNPIANFLWQQEFQNALRNGEQAVPYRKLFFAWAEFQGTQDVNTVSQVLSVIQNVNLKEGLDFAVKVMKSKDQQIWTRAQAMTCVGKMGGKEQVAAFEALFADKTQITTIQLNSLNISTQVNDVALAMAVHLTGQTPKDYGFDALQSQPALLWAYHYLGFTTEEKRVAAFKKYADWSAAQVKKQ